MGKTKQTGKKFDKKVEISAPILDPEIIKAIHSPPKGLRADLKHGGFKALLSDLNSQDSTDELTPLNDNHMPSYIGISCAVSGYSNYSSYSKRSSSPASTAQQPVIKTTIKSSNTVKGTPNRSQTTSPTITRQHADVHHITIDKNNLGSADEERKELTEKLTASATERRRSPSPITPTEDDRHHGAYVGARYCPLPPPSKLVNKHIPLLGIDDDKDPEEVVEDVENKVEQKIASLYGDNFVQDWRESMTHKVKKELSEELAVEESSSKTPKDLVTLKPTPAPVSATSGCIEPTVEVPTPDVKVLANVEKEFLTKLLTDENPPMPKSPSPLSSPVHMTQTTPASTLTTISAGLTKGVSPTPPATPTKAIQEREAPSPSLLVDDSPVPSPHPTAPMSPDSGKSQSFQEEDSPPGQLSREQIKEEHTEYVIRGESPLCNQSSPIRMHEYQDDQQELLDLDSDQQTLAFEHRSEKVVLEQVSEENLLNLSPVHELSSDEPAQVANEPVLEETESEGMNQHIATDNGGTIIINDEEPSAVEAEKPAAEDPVATKTQEMASDNDGSYYLDLLTAEKSFIREQIARAEDVLRDKESSLDEDTLGRIHSAIGKANLLINKKCKQFEGLCESNKKSKGSTEEEQYAVLNDDLAGFWDMLNIQIVDVRKSFESLWKENL